MAQSISIWSGSAGRIRGGAQSCRNYSRAGREGAAPSSQRRPHSAVPTAPSPQRRPHSAILAAPSVLQSRMVVRAPHNTVLTTVLVERGWGLTVLARSITCSGCRAHSRMSAAQRQCKRRVEWKQVGTCAGSLTSHQDRSVTPESARTMLKHFCSNTRTALQPRCSICSSLFRLLWL